MTGRFTRYSDSPFLQLMIPLVATRYNWLAIRDLYIDHPAEIPSAATSALREGEKFSFGKYLKWNFAALGIGATALGLTALYSKRTYDDIRTLYAEAVGYEFNKDPKDVGFMDLMRSKNEALAVTRGAFLRRTAARFAAAGSFWVPWHKLRRAQHIEPNRDTNVSAGVGALSTFFTLDGFIRRPSFFDTEQKLVDTAINHSDPSLAEVVDARHIRALMRLQSKHLDKHYHWPDLASPEGQNEMALATRIANLANQTYNNTNKTGPANFTLGKFNYLVGFGLLDQFPESLAYVELANMSKGMEEVKEVAAAIKKGQDAKSAFAEFGIDMDALVKKYSPKIAHALEEPTVTRFADESLKAKKITVARSAQEFAARDEGPRQPGF